jgi:hypothetical protein
MPCPLFLAFQYDMNYGTEVCLEQPDQSQINGFVQTWSDMKESDDTVNGVKAKKYFKAFEQYNGTRICFRNTSLLLLLWFVYCPLHLRSVSLVR